MDRVEEGFLRALCFYDAINYPPTEVELISAFDRGSFHQILPLTKGTSVSDIRLSSVEASVEPELEGVGPSLHELIRNNRVTRARGRVVFPGREALIAEHEQRECLFPRKLRRARRVARWLARLDGVRFVALCNTTAMAHANEEGDLDFFVICRAGTLWQTRLFATLPFRFLGLRPRSDRVVPDAVCLSFFIDDAALDLTNLQIENDVYFRHWFLQLLPLFDDGVSTDLWSANMRIRERHPHARPWLMNSEVAVPRPRFRLPAFRWMEVLARRIQQRAWPASIRAAMNKDTRVVINDHVLKFHVDDGRVAYREAYYQRCQKYALEA